MPSQFTKRQKKQAPETVVTEGVNMPVTTDPVFTQVGLDVYSPDGGGTYEVAEIEFNPVTGEARVKEIYKISRLIALTYANQKTALNTLKRKLIVKGI